MKFLIALLFGVMAADLPPVPPLLAGALAKIPGARALDPSSDFPPDGYTTDELKDFGYWPPWLITDLDGDGRRDIAAVVVKPGPERQFGVIAVHARTPGTVHWIVPYGKQLINGIAAGYRGGTVTPLYCIECDANDSFLWSGLGYEAGLLAIGERILIATDENNGEVGLFGRPSRNSRLLFPVKACAEAIVRRVAGTSRERWYFIETVGDRSLRGWIPGAFTAAGQC